MKYKNWKYPGNIKECTVEKYLKLFKYLEGEKIMIDIAEITSIMLDCEYIDAMDIPERVWNDLQWTINDNLFNHLDPPKEIAGVKVPKDLTKTDITIGQLSKFRQVILNHENKLKTDSLIQTLKRIESLNESQKESLNQNIPEKDLTELNNYYNEIVKCTVSNMVQLCNIILKPESNLNQCSVTDVFSVAFFFIMRYYGSLLSKISYYLGVELLKSYLLPGQSKWIEENTIDYRIVA